MIKTVWVKNAAGDHLDIAMRSSLDRHGLLIFNFDGLGSPDATIGGIGGPNFDGIRMNSVRTDARHMVLTLAIPGQGDAEEDAKALIYQFFPVKQIILLGVVTDRHNVYIEAVVESNNFNQFSKVENAVISLMCPKPFFKDLYAVEHTLSTLIGTPKFSFPFSNESLINPVIEFGEFLYVPSADIEYTGGVASGCDINIAFSGPATEIVITNTNGSQSMSITPDEEMEDGDQFLFNTRVGEKQATFVRDGVSTNILSLVGLFDPWISIRPGLNTIRITAATGIENLSCDIVFNPLRQGV